MKTTPFLATLLGLAIAAPAGISAIAAPQGARPLELAQAKPKDADEEERRDAKDARDAAREKGAPKGDKGGPERTKDTAAPAKGGEPERTKDTAAPFKGGEPKQSKDEPRREREQDRARGEEKSRQDSSRERDQKPKAVEEKPKQEPIQRTQEPAQRSPEPAQRSQEPAQKAQEPAQRTQEPSQRQQTQDRDRDRARDSRARSDDDERRFRERAREREAGKTPAQELSKTEIRGDRTVTIDGGSRTLRRDGDRVVIRSNDFDRLRGNRGDQRVERRPNGLTRTIVVYPDGAQIITVVGPRGEIVHRARRDRGGREIILFRESRREPVAQINLGPLRLTIPREQYIVDARRASRGDIRMALIAPPVEPVERMYSLEEVRRFDRIRDKMRRIDIDITFDTDSAIITQDQAGALEELASIINEMIDSNPGETFLIEGHTDLVGSDVYNLALSDRRAEAVAIALTDYFNVPPENLVTQGYGEAFPKIPTEQAERENRRTAFRRISPLVAGQN